MIAAILALNVAVLVAYAHSTTPPSGNVIWYTSAGAIQAEDERGLPDACRIDSMRVISTGNVFVVKGGMSAKRAKGRYFYDGPKRVFRVNDVLPPSEGWSIWSVAVLRQ